MVSKEDLILEFLDNTSFDEPGILKFARYFFPETFRDGFAEYHKQIVHDILSLYDPDKKNRFDRQVCEIVFREGGKTTIATFLIPLYIIAFNNYPILIKSDGKTKKAKIHERIILIASETSTRATQFLMNIRRVLTRNVNFVSFFGDLKPRSLKDDKGLWRSDIFQTKNGIYVMAVGSGQQIRGANIDNSRPTLAIIDDIYSKNNVKTPERRRTVSEWFFSELLNAVDSRDGKTIVVNTIVHEDTVPVYLKKDPQWKVNEYPIISIEDLNYVLSKCEIDYDTRTIKPLVDLHKLEKEVKIAWSRFGLGYILGKYQEALSSEGLDWFYREYLHILKSPEERRFKRTYFQKVEAKLEFINGNKYLKVGDKLYPALVFIGVDLAISTKPTSDNTAICVIATTPDRKIYVLKVINGKLTLRDTDERKGVIDEILRLNSYYNPDGIAVETTAYQKAVYDELYRIAKERRIPIRLYPLKPVTEKHERIINTLLPYYEVNAVYHTDSFTELETQLEFLGSAKHDDIPDALSNAFQIMKFPTGGYIEDEKQRKIEIRRYYDWILY